MRRVHSSPPFAELRAALRGSPAEDAVVRDAVAVILAAVAARGDEAVLEYIHRFDDAGAASVAALRRDAADLERAAASIDPALLESLRKAAENIRRFHEQQAERGFLDLLPDGTLLGQRVAPLRRVGLYVPGGRAAYPSSVLMNAIPAAVAGVDEIVMVTPAPRGEVPPMVLAAAHLAGVHATWCVGGAQAVAALAFGTESIEAVDKIVGPGNRWVAEAKRQVFGRVDIDMVAGPSEILIIADEAANPAHAAADLLGQAEHDPDAIAWLVTPHEEVANAVEAAIERLLKTTRRAEIARQSLEQNGVIAVVPDLAAAAQLADLRAPEHLELLVAEPLPLAAQIRNAGAIFLGDSSPEPIGDYFAGPNHVLPTGGTARWASPLGVYDFVKRTSLIGYSPARLAADAGDIIRIAEAEGLEAHAQAVRLRVSPASGNSG